MATSSARSVVSSVFRKSLFNGKTAIVTGGGTGIGKAIATELLYLGCKVMIASRKLDRLQEAAIEIRRLVPSAELEILECNIRREDQVQHLMKKTLDRFGSINFLINNGGGQFRSAASAVTLKGWNAVVETNLTGTFLCCREAYSHYMEEHGGVIINIIADMWKGMPFMVHSGAARAGVDNLTKTLALEWSSNGVRVNSICPGSSIYSPTAANNYDPGNNIFLAQIPRIPAKRLGTVEEISAAVCYLLSPAAAFITGDCIKVDGGQYMYSTSIPWEVPDHDKNKAYTWEDDAKTNSKL